MYKILLNFTFWKLINSITTSPVLPILSSSIFRKAIIIQVHDQQVFDTSGQKSYCHKFIYYKETAHLIAHYT